jgi:dethiobiotin synthetase
LLDKPASPHFSARLENVCIDLKRIKNNYKNISASNDFVITEGAGGLYVPLNEKGSMMIDIPLKLNINTVLVGYAGLGTINHVGLSCGYAHSKKARISAVILISYENTPTDIELENARILKKILKNENVFIIPAVKGADTEKNITGDLLYKLEYFPDADKILEWINE